MQQPGNPLTPHDHPLWIKVFVIVIFALFMCGLISVPGNINATRKLREGQKLYEAGKYQESAQAFEEVLKIKPGSESGKIAEAKSLFKLAKGDSDKRALKLLEGIELSKYQWDELKEAMPAKYQKDFAPTKQKKEKED